MRPAEAVDRFQLEPAACSERTEHRFPTGAAARASDASKRGWVPEWIPPAAKDVRLLCDLDTNEVWIRFELPEHERTALVSGLSAVPWESTGAVKIRSAGTPWWFQGLIQDQPSNDGALNADMFRGPDRVVLLERTGPRVYAYVYGE